MVANRLTLSLPDTIKIEARVRALREGLSLSDVVAALLALWLENRVTIPPETLAELQAHK